LIVGGRATQETLSFCIGAITQIGPGGGRLGRGFLVCGDREGFVLELIVAHGGTGVSSGEPVQAEDAETAIWKIMICLSRKGNEWPASSPLDMVWEDGSQVVKSGEKE